MVNKKPSYKPFKMMLPYMIGVIGAFLGLVIGGVCSGFGGCNPFEIIIGALIGFIIGFLIGWILNSLFRYTLYVIRKRR